ncbi:MAG TPA: SDR family oxidoreductase [Blastococcus sp.]|nr:SDR family oxidoreductase [Blastococcus sp.]
MTGHEAPAAIETMFRVDGRIALVTGASSGLGERFARVLHAAGAQVVVTARRMDRLARLCEQAGSRMTVLPADLAGAADRETLIGGVAERFGRLDILVNNAGTCDNGPLEEQTLDQLTHVLTVNLIAVLDLCRLAAPLLLDSGDAAVINIASMYGLVASRGPMAAHNTSKGALVQLTRHLAAQWGNRGIRVNALAPSYFATDLTGQLEDPGLRQAIQGNTLLQRMPRPDGLDGALLFLASAASSYVTGTILSVDGGWTAV